MDSEIYSLKKHSKTRLLVYKFKFDYLNCPIDSNSALKITTKGNTDFFYLSRMSGKGENRHRCLVIRNCRRKAHFTFAPYLKVETLIQATFRYKKQRKIVFSRL